MHHDLDRITIDPEICNGKPTIRNKRVTVGTILEFLAAGESREEILRQYPSLEARDIVACLAWQYEAGPDLSRSSRGRRVRTSQP